MIHSYEIHGLTVSTGDLLCTRDGKEQILPGEFWRLVGRLIPGEVDHVVIYVGPGGRCAEAGPRGIITFEIVGNTWVSEEMAHERGIIDELYGVASPVEGQGLIEEEKVRIREDVAAYCLAQVGKPYNLNFLLSDIEEAFYCSQLAYKAYLRSGIDLNTGQQIPHVPGTSSIIFPQEIWSGCLHRRAV